jgi:hypothetical protein
MEFMLACSSGKEARILELAGTQTFSCSLSSCCIYPFNNPQYQTKMPPLRELNPNTLLILSSSSTAKKRARDDNDNDTLDPSSFTLPGELDGHVHFDLNCNQIRARINAFLNSGEMKVTHFQRELDINSNSYQRFMKLRGPWKGIDNQTMEAAYLFFKKRDLAGVKMPKKKVKVESREEKEKWDVTGIRLEGEEQESVPVYDTCDDVRRKINAHLRDAPVTKAGFLREICKTFSDPTKSIQSKQLQDFLGYKGATQGSSSGVFYGAYVYFEKLRIKQGKEKSKKRMEMENVYRGQGGMSRERDRGGYWCGGDSRPVEDEYGRVRIVRY